MTQESRENEMQPPRPGGEAVIARALRWSLAVAVVIGVTITALVWYLNKPNDSVTVVEPPPTPPANPHRPAEPPRVIFTDITAASGLDFEHTSGATGEKLLPETMGPGCAFLDYDADGDPDILLVNGRPWQHDVVGASDRPAPAPALFQNDGRGGFTDVTKDVGLDVSFYGMGVAVGDFDNDGWVDVYFTAVGKNRLFRNVQQRFAEVTDPARVGGGEDEWSTSAGFFDYDADGDLDLFVCNYVRWSREIDLSTNQQLIGDGRAYGPPTDFAGTQPYLFRNNANGTFSEIAAEVGLHVTSAVGGEETAVAKALAFIPVDVDQDGRLDVVVANDTVRNFLFRNRADDTFEEIGSMVGVAYDGNGAATGAMGIDAAHYRNDASLAIGIGNFAGEMSSLFVSDGTSAFFSDETIAEGVGPVSRQLLSFGLFFFDYDLDGRLDLFQTNGHLEEEINKLQPSQHYRQPSQLFWNCGDAGPSCFVPVAKGSAGDLARPVVGRAAAYADIDSDGDVDVLLTQTGDRALLFRNDQQEGHHWLRLRLVGSRANRDAIGARVEIDAGGVTQHRVVMPTRSYLSQMETTLTFGLGAVDRVDRIRIKWPGDERPFEIGGGKVDRVRTIHQPR